MKKKIRLILLFFALVVIVAGSFVVWKNPHFLYILGENIGVNRDKIEMNTVFPDNIKRIALTNLFKG